MKPFFNGVLVLTYYFKKCFKPCFVILKTFLQHFELMNLRIRFLMSRTGYRDSLVSAETALLKKNRNNRGLI